MSTEEKTPENNVSSNENNNQEKSTQFSSDSGAVNGLLSIIKQLIGKDALPEPKVVLPTETTKDKGDTIPISRTAEQQAELDTAIAQAVEAKMTAIESQLSALLEPKQKQVPEETTVPAVVPQTPTSSQPKSKVEIFKQKYAQNPRAGAKYFVDNQAEILRNSDFFVNR